MTTTITRTDLTVSALRKEASASLDANASRRMLVIALVLEGQNRETAARS